MKRCSTLVFLICFQALAANSSPLEQWEAFGGVSWGCNGSILAIEASDSGLIYLGGAFTVCEDVVANNVVSYDPVTETFQSLGIDDNGTVRTLAVSGADLYVGGGFSEVGTQPAAGIARWDGGEWHVLGSGDHNGLSGSPWAMAVSGNNLYVGGSFTEAGGLAANHVARWNGWRWFTLGGGEDNGVNGVVSALAVSGDQVYVGGLFSKAGGKLSAGFATLVLQQAVFRDAFEQSPEP